MRVHRVFVISMLLVAAVVLEARPLAPLLSAPAFDIEVTYPPDPQQEPLLTAVSVNQPLLWTTDQGDKILAINPLARFKVVKVLIDQKNAGVAVKDAQGNLIPAGEISGLEVRRSYAVLAALDEEGKVDHGKLNPQTRAVMCRTLYGRPCGLTSTMDRPKRSLALVTALTNLFGYKFALGYVAKEQPTPDLPRVRSQANSLREVSTDPAQLAIRAANAKLVKQKTFDAWNAVFTYPADYYSAQYAYRLNTIRNLNLKNVDPDMVTYFRILDDWYTEMIPVIKAWEADLSREDQDDARQAAQDADCQQAYRLRQPCERDAGGAFPGFVSEGGTNADEKWEPVMDRITGKYDPAKAVVLRKLEIRYQYDYYSSVFDKEANNFYRAADQYWEEKNYSAAAEQAKLALRANPKHLLAHQTLGFCYEELGEYQLALAEFQEAARLNFYPDVQRAMGLSYIELERFSEAERALREASRLKPEDTTSRANLAYSLLKLGRHNEARIQYEMVLKQNPDIHRARLRLGQVYAKLGNRTAALAQYRILQGVDTDLAAELLDLINGGQ